MNRDTPRLNVPADAIDVEDLRDARPGAIIRAPDLDPSQAISIAAWRYLVAVMQIDGFALESDRTFISHTGLRVSIHDYDAEAAAKDAIRRLAERRIEAQRGPR